MYNFNHLYYFYVTVKSGGVSAASKHLKVAQPSLSSQLKVLEQSLDVKLFKKVGRNNELTPDGALVFGFCRHMFEISEEMEEVLSKKIPSALRRVTIGATDEIHQPFVIEIVDHFFKKFSPNLRPKVLVISGTHEQLIERLKFREIDLLISQLSTIDSDLENLDFTEIPVALVHAPTIKAPLSFRGSKFGKVKAATISANDKTHWLMPTTTFKLRSEIDQFFALNQIKGRIVFESDSVVAIIKSVLNGVGAAFLPVKYVAQEINDQRLKTTGPQDGFWKYRIWMISHAQHKSDTLIKVLTQVFIDLRKA